jgi:hypothetical protein
MADDLRRDVELGGAVDNPGRGTRGDNQFHPVPHVKHLIHFLPGGTGFSMDHPEYRGHRKEVVFDHFHPVNEMEDFGLPTSGAMNNAMHLFPEFIQDVF